MPMKKPHPVPENYSAFVPEEEVILTPRYTAAASTVSPIWGSRMGFMVGKVKKVMNGNHNKAEHRCDVQWPTSGSVFQFPNTALEPANAAHRYIAAEWDQNRTVLPSSGVYILVREGGEFYLGYLDFNETPSPIEPYHIMFSQLPMNLEGSDYDILSAFMSTDDFMSVRQATPAAALEVFRRENGFPNHPALTMLDPTRLPKFKSISAAVATLPEGETRDGVMLFSTPIHMYDIGDLGPTGAITGPDEVDEAVMAHDSLGREVDGDTARYISEGNPDQDYARYPTSSDI